MKEEFITPAKRLGITTLMQGHLNTWFYHQTTPVRDIRACLVVLFLSLLEIKMAEKRMFSKKIIDTDWFMDMPASTQNLYFHLSMRADDDGFISNPKRIIRLIGASEDDFSLLVVKRFIIPFESGVCVISDWRINNYLRGDRYTETIYKQEKEQLTLDDKGKYICGIPNGIPSGIPSIISNSNTNTNSNSSNIIEEDKKKHKYGEYNHVLLSDKQLEKLNKDYGEETVKKAIKFLDECIQEKAYKSKDHNLAIRRWVIDAVKEKQQKQMQKGVLTQHDYSNKDFDSVFDEFRNMEI